jgi:HK97 family phage major capsid protein
MATATDDVRELKAALQKNLDIMDGIAGEFVIDGANVEVKSEDAANYRHALAEAEKIKGILELKEGHLEVKGWAEGTGGTGGLAAAVAAGMGAFSAEEMKSLGEMFTESDEFKALKASGSYNMQSPWNIETNDLGGFGRKDVFSPAASLSGVTQFGTVRQRDPMVPRAQRMTRVRDLFPVANTSANLIEYFRVIGFGTTRLDLSSGAAPVRDRAAANGTSAPVGDATDVFGLKPKSNLKFESASAPVRTIAHYEVAHRNVLDDEPQLQATINNELLYGLRLEEDKQILLGDGTGENLLGILNTPNIQGYTQGTSDATETKADALRRAATRAVLAYYPPSGYVLHPYDWEDIELQKATGDGQYVMATNVAVGAETRAWRQPVVESPAMPEGTFLTGAWGLGAQLYDRQQANIRIADQHADFFIRNAVAILAEMRLALAVKRPESFVKGTFTS